MADRHDRTARESPSAQPFKSVRERFFDYLMDEKRLPSIGKELAYGVADIRQKLVEEATYGRAVTPDHQDGIHGRAAPEGKGDPLGRSLMQRMFPETIERPSAGREPQPPEPGDRGPDR